LNCWASPIASARIGPVSALRPERLNYPTTSPNLSPMRKPGNYRNCIGHPRLADAPSASKPI
jgi:hypothetical protein